MKTETKYILWLFAACVAVFFAHLDALPVNIMEARNFITAREMLLDDNWLLTTINGEARYQKPPLPTWLTAFSAGIFGLESLYAMRLPAVLMAIFGVFFFYRFVTVLTKHKELAFISSLILITSFFFAFAGRNGQWDIFTHGFMIAAIYWGYLFFYHTEKRYRNALFSAFFIGLSFMSKGPVSLYVLFLPFVLAYGFAFKFRAFQKKWLPLFLWLLVALVISGWWYLYTYIFDTDTILNITNKETANWTNYNVKPFYYYWNFFMQTGLWILPGIISLMYPYLKDKVIHKKAYLFSLLWTLLTVVLLSIIPEKKQRYLLPVVIPFALNIGFYMEYIFRTFSEMRRAQESVPVYLQFSLVAIVGFLAPFVGGVWFWESIGDQWPWYILLSIAIFFGACYIVYHLRHRNIKNVFYASIIFTACAVVFGMPLIGVFNTNTAQNDMTELATWEKKNDIKVYEYSAFAPEFLWQYGNKMERIEVAEYENLVLKKGTIGVLVHENAVSKFLENSRKFEINIVEEYDINPVLKSNTKHNFRLHRYLYQVTTKQ